MDSPQLFAPERSSGCSPAACILDVAVLTSWRFGPAAILPASLPLPFTMSRQRKFHVLAVAPAVHNLNSSSFIFVR